MTTVNGIKKNQVTKKNYMIFHHYKLQKKNFILYHPRHSQKVNKKGKRITNINLNKLLTRFPTTKTFNIKIINSL